MKSRNRRSNLSGATWHVMIDLFAIPLVIVTSQNQCYYDSAPIVVRQAAQASQPPPSEPFIVELSSERISVAGAPVEWTALEHQFHQLAPTAQIIVRASCDDRGQGPLAELMRISLLAQQAKVADRLFVVTREPDSPELPLHQ